MTTPSLPDSSAAPSTFQSVAAVAPTGSKIKTKENKRKPNSLLGFPPLPAAAARAATERQRGDRSAKKKTESKHTHIKRKKNGQEQQKKTDRRDGRREPIRVAPLAAVPAGWQSHKWLLLRQKRSRASTFDPIIGQIPRNAITDRLAPIGWPSASRGRWWSREKRIAPSHWSTMTSFADRSESDQSEGADVVGGRPARPRQSSAIQRSKMTSFVHGDQ